MRKLLGSCAGVLCAVTLLEPALAADRPARPRAPAAERAAPARPAPQQQAANWNGGQVGGSNGASSVNNNFVDPGSYVCPLTSTFGSNCFETPFNFSGTKTVYTVGPFVGYRLQFGSIVVGIEGDWSWKNAESSLSQSSQVLIIDNFGDNFLRTDQFFGSVKQKSDYSIRGRVGTLVTPWSLLYATGGVAFSEISGSLSYSGAIYSCPGAVASAAACASALGVLSPTFSDATAMTTFTWSDTRTGYTVGAGWETELFPGWKGRLEYRYTDFGKYTKTFGLATSCTGAPSAAPSSCTASPSSSVSVNLDESFHTIRVGLALDLWSLVR
jgi:outer membrane immunogenic protein